MFDSLTVSDLEGSSQEPGPVKDPLTPEELPVTKQVQLNSDKDGGDH